MMRGGKTPGVAPLPYPLPLTPFFQSLLLKIGRHKMSQKRKHLENVKDNEDKQSLPELATPTSKRGEEAPEVAEPLRKRRLELPPPRASSTSDRCSEGCDEALAIVDQLVKRNEQREILQAERRHQTVVLGTLIDPLLKPTNSGH